MSNPPFFAKASFTNLTRAYHWAVTGTGSRLIRINNDSALADGLNRALDESRNRVRLIKITNDAAPVVGNGKQEEKVS